MLHPLRLFTHCPRCGSPTFADHDAKSRRCNACGFVYYHNPSAAVVALITDAHGRWLVCRRAKEPARGTMDLPGGFVDCHETIEQALRREVTEETGLTVSRATYLFSLPNIYPYSGFEVHTVDLFFRVSVESDACAVAADDVAEIEWMDPADIRAEQFGLTSIRKGVERLLAGEVGNG